MIVLVRDPRPAVASACSLYEFLGRSTLDDLPADRFGPYLARSLARTLTRGLADAAEEPERVRVVRYEDLVADPVGTVAEIQAGFGLPFSARLEDAARAWMAANQQDRHGVHAYELASYGLDEETVLRLFEGAELAMSRMGLSIRK